MKAPSPLYLCSKSTGAVTSCTRKYFASAGCFRCTASQHLARPPSLLPRRNRILQCQADEALIRQSCVNGALAHSIIEFFGQAQID